MHCSLQTVSILFPDPLSSHCIIAANSILFMTGLVSGSHYFRLLAISDVITFRAAKFWE